MKKNYEKNQLPDAIVGDLDSIRPSVREHYEKLGVPILEDANQDTPDFTKCLKYLNVHAAEILAAPRQRAGNDPTVPNKKRANPSNTTLKILILGGLGGRVDQAFSQIHYLYMMTPTQRAIRGNQRNGNEQPSKGGNLYLISEESITFILESGRNVIYTPGTRTHPSIDIQEGLFPTKTQTDEESRKRKRDEHEEYFFEENVGIIPFSGPACITTHGLQWDVQDWHTEIGGQISTSNHIRAEKIEVQTSVPVLFTMELDRRFKRRLR